MKSSNIDSQIYQFLVYLIFFLLSACCLLLSQKIFGEDLSDTAYFRLRNDFFSSSVAIEDQYHNWVRHINKGPAVHDELISSQTVHNQYLSKIIDLEYQIFQLKRVLATMKALPQGLYYHTAIPAEVINRDSSGRVLIHHSEQMPILENQLVFSKAGMIGLITKTGERVSQLSLIDSGSQIIAARDINNKSSGVVKNDVNGTTVYHAIDGFLPPEIIDIVTSENSDKFPPGLYIGSVDARECVGQNNLCQDRMHSITLLPSDELAIRDTVIVIDRNLDHA